MHSGSCIPATPPEDSAPTPPLKSSLPPPHKPPAVCCLPDPRPVSPPLRAPYLVGVTPLRSLLTQLDSRAPSPARPNVPRAPPARRADTDPYLPSGTTVRHSH